MLGFSPGDLHVVNVLRLLTRNDALTRSLLSIPKRTALLLIAPERGSASPRKGNLQRAVSSAQYPVKDIVPLPQPFRCDPGSI
jgi:hypothetical protein